jgi:hypothetical protein
MTGLFRILIIVIVVALTLSLPAYLLLNHELSDPDQMLPGLVVLTLAPVIGFPIPLVVILVVVWWLGFKISPLVCVASVVGAILTYDVAVSFYVVFLQPNSAFGNANWFNYVTRRVAWSLPGAVVATIVTAIVTWFACRLVPAKATL